MSPPAVPATVRVPVAEAMRLGVAALTAVGVPLEDAEVQARWLLEADCRGYGSHGIQRLPLLVQRIERGLAAPVARPVLDWRGAALLAVDGQRGLGPVVALHALEEAIARVRDSGIVLVAVSNANHLGMLAPYVEWLCDRSLIGIACTTSEALVHPHGGRRAMVGTNPVAIGVPSTPRPLVVDVATGVVSMGKILRHRELGAPLEPGWAVDAAGQPTLDPQAALDGAISPFGGAKGFALGLAFEVLVGALTDSAVGRQVTGTLDANSVCNKGDLFFCIDPSTTGTAQFAADRVSSYLAALREEPGQDAERVVRLPGDRSLAMTEESIRLGVEVPTSVWHATLDLANALGVEGPRSGEATTGQ